MAAAGATSPGWGGFGAADPDRTREQGRQLRERGTERRPACWHSTLRALYLIPKLCAFSISIRSALALRLVLLLLAEDTRLSLAVADRPLGSGSDTL